MTSAKRKLRVEKGVTRGIVDRKDQKRVFQGENPGRKLNTGCPQVWGTSGRTKFLQHKQACSPPCGHSAGSGDEGPGIGRAGLAGHARVEAVFQMRWEAARGFGRWLGEIQLSSSRPCMRHRP